MYIAVCEDQKDLANSLRRDIESSFAYQDGEFVLTVMLKNKAETEQEGTELAI